MVNRKGPKQGWYRKTAFLESFLPTLVNTFSEGTTFNTSNFSGISLNIVKKVF